MDKLLIVDDSLDLLEIMKYIVEFNGYTAKTLTNTDNIYQEIHEYQPDLLILDIFVGDTDGRELCKELRKNADTAYLGILAISASSKALTNYKSFYADDFLEKPFDIRILIEKIHSILTWTPIRKKAFSLSGATGQSRKNVEASSLPARNILP